jgi:hypothetical protein
MKAQVVTTEGSSVAVVPRLIDLSLRFGEWRVFDMVARGPPLWVNLYSLYPVPGATVTIAPER